MRSHAAVVVDGERCTTLRSDPPLTLRETPGAVHMVGSAAGPVGGDDLQLDVELKAGTSLTMRSVAAQLLFPGPSGRTSHARVRVGVGAGAALAWLPEPVVLVKGADHHSETTITMAGDASVVWCDVTVLGRHAEVTGSLRQRLRVERNGGALLCTETRLGPAWPHADGAAGVGDHRVVATILVIGRRAPTVSPMPNVRAGVCTLAHDAVLITALTDSTSHLGPLLNELGG